MVQAYVLVAVEAGRHKNVIDEMRAMPGVKQVHTCWGRPDVFSFVEVADEQTLADTVVGTIQAIPGVQATETHIVLPL